MVKKDQLKKVKSILKSVKLRGEINRHAIYTRQNHERTVNLPPNSTDYMLDCTSLGCSNMTEYQDFLPHSRQPVENYITLRHKSVI